MANYRKDIKGRVLRPGEYQRKSDNMYGYIYRDPYGKRRRIYSKDLIKLREKIKKISYDQLSGIDTHAAKNTTINELFDRYMSMKVELRESTRTYYLYMYDRFVRDGFGKKTIDKVKYSDVMRFFIDLAGKGLAVATVDGICRLISPAFATRLCEVESNLKTIQAIMGHADIQTTMNIYAEATESGLNHAMESLSQRRSFLKK